jgi:hypothetical protein
MHPPNPTSPGKGRIEALGDGVFAGTPGATEKWTATPPWYIKVRMACFTPCRSESIMEV